MSPYYPRSSDVSDNLAAPAGSGGGSSDETLTVAAEALRETDIEAAEPGGVVDEGTQLESMSVDQLRAFASELHVPNCGQIVEQAELIAAIRQRL